MRKSSEIQIEINKLMVEFGDAKAVERKADEAYLNLNNLYLDIQAGNTKLTRTIYNRLQDLMFDVCPDPTDTMRKWWWAEFQKLPGWLNV